MFVSLFFVNEVVKLQILYTGMKLIHSTTRKFIEFITFRGLLRKLKKKILQNFKASKISKKKINKKLMFNLLVLISCIS